jgi:L-asparaginase
MLALAHEPVPTRSRPAGGIVVTRGTDSLEETALALELLVGPERPLVVTGAMRSDSPGSDGPRNLLDAALVATDRSSRGLGVVVVMGGEVHAPRYVTKLHTTACTRSRPPTRARSGSSTVSASPSAGPRGGCPPSPRSRRRMPRCRRWPS